MPLESRRWHLHIICYNNDKEIQIESQYQTALILSLKFEIQDGTVKPNYEQLRSSKPKWSW